MLVLDPLIPVLVLPKSTTSSWESFICYHNVLFYRKMVKIIYNRFQIKETKPGNNWYSYIKELYQCPCPQLSVYSFPHLTFTWLNWLLSAFHLLAKQIENNYAHAQYYDCLSIVFSTCTSWSEVSITEFWAKARGLLEIITLLPRKSYLWSFSCFLNFRNKNLSS